MNVAATDSAVRDVDAEALSALGRVVGATVVLSIVASPALWWTDGWLSPVLVVDWPPVPVLRALVVGIVVCALVVALGVRPRSAPIVLAGLLILRAAPDRTAWQSYSLEWTMVCAIVGWATRYGNAREGVVAIRLAIGLLFAWAGLHKVNPAFVANGMGAIVAQWGWPAPPPWVNVAIAVIEVALGVGLLVPRTRRIAAYGLVVWSLTVALGLSAMGLNRAVVPWNVGHAVMSMWLARAPSSPARGGWTWARRPSLLVVATVFGVMPALHVLGWPPYLALRLYTGSSPIALLHLNEPEVLPAAARRVARREESGTFRAVLDVQRWAHEATGAFVPPENAVFEGVLGHVCRRVRRPREVLLVVVERDEHWRRAPETRYLRCADVIAEIR